MKTIGLIGDAVSWESTAVYYRLINEAVRQQRGGLHSAEIAMRSLDFTRVVELQKAGRWDDAGTLLGEAGAGLARSGAACVLICTNTMHLVSEPVAAMSGVPLIDIIDETAKALRADGRRRPLLLATRYTMEHGFYAERMKRHGIEVVVPETDDRGTVHDVIFNELCQGKVHDASRARYLRHHRGRSRSRHRLRHPGLHRNLPCWSTQPPSPSRATTQPPSTPTRAVRFALADELERAA
jgi:aspartate racemase